MNRRKSSRLDPEKTSSLSDRTTTWELRGVQLQEEGGESEFEAGIYGAESDEASADSLSLRLVEGAASDLVLEAIALSEREDTTKKHVGEDVGKRTTGGLVWWPEPW